MARTLPPAQTWSSRRRRTRPARRLLAHELTHVAQQGRTGTARVDRKEIPDARVSHISQADADATTDDELSSAATLVKIFLRDHPDEEVVTANLAVLESTMSRRQAAARAHPPPPTGVAGPLGPRGRPDQWVQRCPRQPRRAPRAVQPRPDPSRPVRA